MCDSTSNVKKLQSKFIDGLEEFSNLFVEVFSNAEKNDVSLSFGSSLAGVAIGSLMKALKYIPGKSESALDLFIDRSRHHHLRIAKKDLSFLQKDAFSLFEGVPKDKLAEISSLFDNPSIVTPALLEQMWDKLTHITILSVKYVHWKRWGIDIDTGKEGYIIKYFPANPESGDPGFSVKKAVEIFGIQSLDVD